MLLFAKFKLRDLVRLRDISPAVVNSIVVVLSLLNSLMSDQVSRLRITGIRASVIDVKEPSKDKADEHDLDESTEVDINFCLCEENTYANLRYYHIVFSHPEALISSRNGRELLSEKYQRNVVAIVVDEAHCIVEWSV